MSYRSHGFNPRNLVPACCGWMPSTRSTICCCSNQAPLCRTQDRSYYLPVPESYLEEPYHTQSYRSTRRSTRFYDDVEFSSRSRGRRRQRDASRHYQQWKSPARPHRDSRTQSRTQYVASDLEEEDHGRMMGGRPEHDQDDPFNDVVQRADFKAAASKLFSTLRRAEKFLDRFLRSFQQEMSANYLDYATNWKRKVKKYTRDFTLPNAQTDRGNTNSTSSTTSDDQQHSSGRMEQVSFEELQYHIIHDVDMLLSSKLDNTLERDGSPFADDEDFFELPETHDIDQEIKLDIAEALLRGISRTYHELKYVQAMASDHKAAPKALAFVKKTKRLCEEYRAAWMDGSANVSEQSQGDEPKAESNGGWLNNEGSQ